VVFAIRDDDDDAPRLAALAGAAAAGGLILGEEGIAGHLEPRRQRGASLRDALGRQVAQEQPHGLHVGGERTLNEGAAGERDDADAVLGEGVERGADLGLCPLEPIGADIARPHRARDVDDEEEIEPLARQQARRSRPQRHGCGERQGHGGDDGEQAAPSTAGLGGAADEGGDEPQVDEAGEAEPTKARIPGEQPEQCRGDGQQDQQERSTGLHERSSCCRRGHVARPLMECRRPAYIHLHVWRSRRRAMGAASRLLRKVALGLSQEPARYLWASAPTRPDQELAGAERRKAVVGTWQVPRGRQTTRARRERRSGLLQPGDQRNNREDRLLRSRYVWKDDEPAEGA
jgi:hypothetical protein